MGVSEVVKDQFKRGGSMKVIHLREIYSETPGSLLDKRKFRRLCIEAGFELTIYKEEKRNTLLTLTPAQVQAFKKLHGNPYDENS